MTGSVACTQRVLFALAGTMTLLSVGLALTVSPWALALGTLVGANQLLYATTGLCPASLAMHRVPFVASRCGA